ncbi:MAG: hypothetical protein FWH33_02250 [Oscillospiraceae bacterium]|nr:hypothetical protein [Oscillospiraceae bacterium]
MRYDRVPFKAEGAAYKTEKIPFSMAEFDIPILDTPITPAENYKLSWKRLIPVWAPMAMLDFDSLRIKGRYASNPVFGKERVEYTDDWGCEWVYVPEAGGSMLKPGTQLIKDITQWEKVFKFPDWKDNDFAGPAEDFYKNRRDPKKALSLNIGEGCSQILVSVMGGYGEAMLAVAEEPEAVVDFYNAFVDNQIEKFDILRALYPDADIVGFNDDWGNERSTFYSPKMFEELLFEPTKRMIDHMKACGDVCFELHSCGKIETFVPFMIDMGADILQIQRRANDMPLLKEKYGDKIGFCCMIEGLDMAGTPAPEITKEERLEKLRDTIDIYGRSGGLYLSFFAPDSETLWDMIQEAYCYSREKYDNERAEV